MPGLNTEPVPAPPARTVGLLVEAVTTGRLSTVLTVSVLQPLLLSETLLVTGTLEGSPPTPGRTAGLVVKVEVVTAVVRCEDSFIVSFRIGMCGSSEADVQTAGFDLLTIRIESESFLNEISSSTSEIYSRLNL